MVCVASGVASGVAPRMVPSVVSGMAPGVASSQDVVLSSSGNRQNLEHHANSC